MKFVNQINVVLDVGNALELNDKQRVDAINNFDFARDFDTRVMDLSFNFQNRTLTDFTRCKTNRVLLHDDISANFLVRDLKVQILLSNH